MPEPIALLRQIPAFALLPEAALRQLAAAGRAQAVLSGAVVIREGDPGNDLYLIHRGIAEVTQAGPDGPVLLAALGPGECFGEMALFSAGGRRSATVTAVTPLHLFLLAMAQVRAVLAPYPAATRILAQTADALTIATFLKRAAPFAHLDRHQLHALAQQVTRCTVPAGTEILREGDRGDMCYLLLRGRVEIITGHGVEARVRTTLEDGALFGEAALLTESPRNATVRAATPCEMLRLTRDALVAAMAMDRQLYGQMMEMLQLRTRPRRRLDVLHQTQTNAEGTTFTILKDPTRGCYFRLSAEGWCIWELLDGEHNLRDLTLAYFLRFKAFAPQWIAELIGGLAAAGLLGGHPVRAEILLAAPQASWWLRGLVRCRRVLEWRRIVRSVDPWFARWYRRGVHRLFSVPGQVLLAAIALGGGAAFAVKSGMISRLWAMAPPPFATWGLLLPLLFLAIVLHEAGHAFTVKAFGREVMGIGVGWYWYGPIAFVDTSDMWLTGRWPRIAVNLAGPYTNVILAGCASLAALVIPLPAVALCCWLFALGSYAIVLVNLNPLLEYDGYYVLMDWLDRPNLRRNALRWLWHEFPRALVRPALLRGHGFDLIYSLGSIAYSGGVLCAAAATLAHFLLATPA